MKKHYLKNKKIFLSSIILSSIFLMSLLPYNGKAQTISDDTNWILPDDEEGPAIWGIRGGIVFSLWPFTVEPDVDGPRGLLRIGHNFEGRTYLINFIAIEPVVDGEIEFSEISPSRVDGKIGKFLWASNNEEPGRFNPNAVTRGNITQPDPNNPEIEKLSLYVFMEKFLNGAHPYLKITIRSDRPEEMEFQIFHREDSAQMDRCTLTATMGNYSRLRLLYLKNRVIDSRKLYKGYDGLHFIEEKEYPVTQLIKDENGDFIAIATSDESFSELSSWPQDSAYYERQWWRYRPFYKIAQYWRKESTEYDSSLRVRVNGRAKYYSGGSEDESDYIDIPGGVSFENFEMREKYYPGQKFYFGITKKSPEKMDLNIAQYQQQ